MLDRAAAWTTAVLISLALPRWVDSFSYNLGARTVFTPGENANNHSYFGYSLVLRGGDRPLIVVGAPRDTSFYIGHAAIKDPGAIYMCNILPNAITSVCQQKILDSEGNTRRREANGKSYHHRKDNMWLGMTVEGSASNNGTLVMCAPRWINQIHKEYHLANGICYALSQTQASLRPSEILQLLPLVDTYDQGFTITRPGETQEVSTYYYAYGQAGISMKLSEDGTELLIGAPGIYVWTGSVIRYRIMKQTYGKDYFSKKNVQNPYYTPELTDTSYFGYSVDLGKFISGRTNLYVAGAPRGAEYKGQVLLFDFPMRDSARYIIFAILEGHQLGEYFGSALAAIDINQDGLSDLIVGAPMYAQKLSSDQGRVYVYMNHDKANMVEQQATICGSFQENARFGTSISSIGDINDDGFTDVAIGAPYENNGKGAVYIYLGAANGLNPDYVQRIVMDDLQGFGISISKGVDIDNNSCNDIAIGAYESAKAVLLRCHPSVGITSKMEAFPSELSLGSTNFTIKLCHTFIGTTSSITDILVTLSVDQEYTGASLENPSDKTYKISGARGNSYCNKIIVLIDPSNDDFSRPTEVKMNFDLIKNPMLDSTFCERCPVLRPFTIKEQSLRVPFATGCGNDLVCQPDLKLSVEVVAKSPYVIGSTPSIPLNISVQNVGEPAFLARVEFTPPAEAPLLRVPHRCHLVDSLLSCDFENPLSNGSQSFVIVELDTSLLTSFHSVIKFNVTVTSGGEEVTPEDNKSDMEISLITESKILVIGEAAADAYVYFNPSSKIRPNTTISHTYEVLNQGPTSLDVFQMKYYIPVAYFDEVTNTNYTLVNVFEPRDVLNQAPFLCNAENGNFFTGDEKGYAVNITNDSLDSTQSYDRTTEPGTLGTVTYTEGTTYSYRESRNLFTSDIFDTNTEVELPTTTSNEDYPATKAFYLNCTDKMHVTCLVVNCIKIGGLPSSGNGAHMVLRMRLNNTNMEEILKKQSPIMLTTYAVALNPGKQINVFGSTWSLIIGGNPPPPSTPIWIIIVAVLLGILLLAAISFGLYKFDFFKRKTKEELQLLKNQDSSNAETTDEITDDDP